MNTVTNEYIWRYGVEKTMSSIIFIRLPKTITKVILTVLIFALGIIPRELDLRMS